MPYSKDNKCWTRKTMNPSTGKVSKWTTCLDAQKARASKPKSGKGPGRPRNIQKVADSMGAYVVQARPVTDSSAKVVKAIALPTAKALQAKKGPGRPRKIETVAKAMGATVVQARPVTGSSAKVVKARALPTAKQLQARKAFAKAVKQGGIKKGQKLK